MSKLNRGRNKLITGFVPDLKTCTTEGKQDDIYPVRATPGAEWTRLPCILLDDGQGKCDCNSSDMEIDQSKESDAGSTKTNNSEVDTQTPPRAGISDGHYPLLGAPRGANGDHMLPGPQLIVISNTTSSGGMSTSYSNPPKHN